MPFTYRDKPNLADRLRGKSGEEILNELKSDLDSQGRRIFFDSPSWRTRPTNSAFLRGFSFDDDRNRINIRTYLDEIASRHPEFADQLKERPWSKDFVDPSFRNTGGESHNNPGSEASGSSQKPEVENRVQEKEASQNLSNFGLRNTVPLGPGANAGQNRQQRSMSAPPDNRAAVNTKKFITKCEIPVMNNPTQEQVPVDFPGRGPQEQAQQKANNAPTVRVIPIQVEGRDAPLVNTNVDTATNFGGETFKEPAFEGRLPRDFGTYQRHSPRFVHKERTPTPPQYHQYAPQFQQHYIPTQQTHFMPQHFASPEQQAFAQQHYAQRPAPAPSPQYQQQYPPQQHQQYNAGTKLPQADEVDSKPSQPKVEPVKDPIEKVQAIQKDVEELMRQVEAFTGNSRTDKQYLMLDELLTRQLLLLDVIDTEGKENVRQARKDTIRSIQRCISTLENKVPLVENNPSINDSNLSQGGESGSTQLMVLDSTKENTPINNKDSQIMEVDQIGNSQSQDSVQQQQQQQQQQQLQFQLQEQLESQNSETNEKI